MKVEVAVLGSLSNLIVPMVGLCGRKVTLKNRVQELYESRGGRPGLPVLPNSPYGLCGRKATLKNRSQELCESRGGRTGLPVPNSPYGLCGRKATLKNRSQELCECRGGRPGLPPSLISPTVSVDVKQRERKKIVTYTVCCIELTDFLN